ncbi:MAG: rod shape-determining protein MreC [Flavobacteriaceae bacterium]|nr:rod shape-determining protein MreC [Flavobacteriaceae bacterium]
MNQIISFLTRYKFFLLFLLLEIIALSFTIQSHSFHRSKFINSSNSIIGFVYENLDIIGNYKNLTKYNLELAEENIKLKKLLTQKNDVLKTKKTNTIDSILHYQKFTYIDAIVKNNVYTKSNNILTINKGKKDSIIRDLGVINSKGIIGIVANSSKNYATVMSILNENSKINARLKKNLHFGTLTWNAKDYKTIQFEDLPRQANIKIGDTIITDGKSTIFPEGILVGIIKDFKLANNNYKIINIELFNDMSAIKHINIVTNLYKTEIQDLENNYE